MTENLTEPIEPVTQVRKKSLKDEVFELLHQHIVAGRCTPGEWLRQEEIASRLGVSQTPVREALDLLVSVGLAERVPFRGVRVPELSATEIVDAYLMRLELESMAACLAAQNRSEEQKSGMSEIIQQTRFSITLEDMSRQRQLNKSFHLMIAEASGSTLLCKLYEMVSNLFPDWRLYEYMFRHPELLENSLEKEYQEHKAILDAISAQNQELAVQVAAQHIRNLGDEIVNYLDVPRNLLKEKEMQLTPLLCSYNLDKSENKRR